MEQLESRSGWENKIWSAIEAVVYRMFKKISELSGEDFTDKYLVSFLQFLRFGIVGLSNTAVSYILYVVFLFVFLRIGMLLTSRYLVAQGIAFVISVVWSFYWNNKLVFALQEGDDRSILKALVKTFISYSFTGLFLSSILLVVWVKVLHISEFIAPIINLLVTVPLNFVINKFWAFGKQGLGDEVYQESKENPGKDVLEFLHAVMYPHKKEFLDTVKKYIDFSFYQAILDIDW